MSSRIPAFLCLALLLSVASGAAIAKGRLGFSVEAGMDSAISTTLKQVRVSAVAAGSPAAQAGLRVGDIITKLAGKQVAGSNGNEMKSTLGGVKPGERLKLVVLRADGRSVPLVIVAAGDATATKPTR